MILLAQSDELNKHRISPPATTRTDTIIDTVRYKLVDGVTNLNDPLNRLYNFYDETVITTILFRSDSLRIKDFDNFTIQGKMILANIATHGSIYYEVLERFGLTFDDYLKEQIEAILYKEDDWEFWETREPYTRKSVEEMEDNYLKRVPWDDLPGIPDSLVEKFKAAKDEVPISMQLLEDMDQIEPMMDSMYYWEDMLTAEELLARSDSLLKVIQEEQKPWWRKLLDKFRGKKQTD